jgi:hypothetical protein
VLLAENGSTDGTPALLERLTAANPRLRWFHSTTPNYGAALKQGMLEARGELVFCDEIDLCDLSFYDRALELLGDPAWTWWWGARRRAGGGSPAAHPPGGDAGAQRPAAPAARVPGHGHPRAQGLPPRAAGPGGPGLRGGPRRVRLRVRGAGVARRLPGAGDPHPAGGEAPAVDQPPRRVPNVLRQVAKLVWVIRVRAGERRMPGLASISIDLDGLPHYAALHGLPAGAW